MNKKIGTIFLACTLALLLAGCQFALEADETKAEDLFVGVSLRIEDYGEPTGLDADGNPYWESEEEPVELTDAQAEAILRGDDMPLGQQEWPVGKYAFYLIQREDESGSYDETVNSWPGDSQVHITVTDEGEVRELKLQVYLCGEDTTRYDVSHGFVSMYIDNVYRRPDGSLYCVHENGGVSGHIGGFTQTIKQETTVKSSDGKMESNAMEVSVEFIQVPVLQSARVLSFDAEYNLLETIVLDPKKTEYGVEDCEILPPAGTAYMILEETAIDEQGETVITRSLAEMPQSEYERSIALFTLYIPSQDHLALPCYVRLPEQA